MSEYYPIYDLLDGTTTIEEYVSHNVYDEECLDRLIAIIDKVDDEEDEPIYIDNLQELAKFFEVNNVHINEDDSRLTSIMQILTLATLADEVLSCKGSCSDDIKDVSVEEHF